MSQAGSFRRGGGPIMGYVQTITGDNAVAVPPNNLGNLNIIGAGGITVVGDAATNTLEISGSLTDTVFTTDSGDATPVGGVLRVLGDTVNMTTIAATANTVEVKLNDSVNLAGSFQVAHTASIGTGLTVLAGGITSTGLTTLPSLTTAGVMQVNAAHQVFADDGTGDGQVLISSASGAPSWRTLTAGTGIEITEAANQITIATSDTGGLTVHTDGNDAVETDRAISILGFRNIETAGIGSTVNISLKESILLTGSIVAGAEIRSLTYLRAADGVTVDVGDIRTFSGDIIASNELKAGNGLTVNAGGITSTGTTTLNSLVQGVVQSTAGGELYSSDSGTQGRFLISGTGNPEWGGLTSSDGSIQITPGDHTIDIKAIAAGSGGSAFSAHQTVQAPACFGLIDVYSMGTEAAFTVDFDGFGGAFYPGDGAGAESTFTASVTGKYFFQFEVSLTTITGVATPGAPYLQIWKNGTLLVSSVPFYSGSTTMYSPTRPTTLIYTETLALTVNDIITWHITIYPGSTSGNTKKINIEATDTRLSGFLIGGTGSGGGASSFVTDLGIANQAGGTINIQGGQNINTEAAPAGGQNVIINLDNDVIVPVSGSLTLPFTDGVVQTNSSGLVTSTAGIDGQVLIGSSVGSAAWSTLTAGSGISIVNGHNTATISTTGSGVASLAFCAKPTATVSGIFNTGSPYSATQTYNIGASNKGILFSGGYGLTASWYPGDGLLAPAYYQAPYTGIYLFNMLMQFYFEDVYCLNLFEDLQCMIGASTPSAGVQVWKTANISSSFTTGTGFWLADYSIGPVMLNLTAGDKVYFKIEELGPSTPSLPTKYVDLRSSANGFQTSVYGYRVS
jgi:hypothetical protein